jgi:autotransporter-associated beta strand protein
MRAFAGENTSEYTKETDMSTRPVDVGVIDIDSYEPELTWGTAITTWDFTNNGWNNGSAVFTDGKKTLFAPEEDVTVTLNETVKPAAVVVNSDANLTIEGSGAISGETSVNKAGEGTLTLNTLNTYTGATVLHEGTLAFNTLKNGGVASAIGQSVNFAQNWVMDGGTYRYTGGTTSTDRSAKLSGSTVFEIADAKATVTMNGVIEGTSAANNFILDGNGQLTVGTSKFFGYTGQTILRGGILYLSTTDISKAGIGSSSKLVMSGGHLQTKGESSGYETYAFPIEVVEGTTSQLSPNRNCYINSKVTGAGTLQLNIPYLREYVQGDWSGFTGRLIANGVSSDKRGSLLLLDKQPKLDKAVIELKGNANLCYWSTNGTQTIGGISGSSGTYINGSSKQTDGFTCKWTVGSANTDETFRGSINNWSCSGSGHSGTVSITKTGTGLWRLTGTNDYKGTTTVNDGLLIVNGKHTGTGAVTVNAGAALGGKGTIAGAVTIKSGAMLWVGDTLATDKGLTFSGGLKLEEGAILRLNDAMMGTTFADNTAIQVFNGKVSGQGFSQIEPAQPSSTQAWDTSELLSKGVLYVRPYDPVGVKATDADIKPAGNAQQTTYSLNGRQYNGHTKGLYIRNGKKHIH